MKKTLIFAAVALLAAFTACKKEEPDSVVLKSEPTVAVETAGGVATVSFSANKAWTVTSDQTWVTVNPASGQAGEVNVKLSVPKNEGYDDRTANITITVGTMATAKVTLVQGQLNGLEVAEKEFVVPAEGGNVEVAVSSNVDYTVEIPEAADWIVTTKGLVDSKVLLSVAPTEEYVQDPETWAILEDAIVRTANVTISGGGLKQVVSISQKAFVPCFEYEGDWAGLQWSFYDGVPVIFPQEGGTFVIPVNTNIGWRAYMSVWSEEAQAGVDIWDNGWCKLDFDTEANTITLTIQPNESYFSREDYLYTVGIINGEEDGNFGGLGWFQQAGIQVEGATAEFVWGKALADLSIPAAYNRLAYTATGALLISDGEKVHAVSPADGSYFKAITYPGITPTSICSDDAGNVIVMSDVEAAMNWDTAELISGTELTIYYSADPNEMTKSIKVPNLDYGTVGGLRVRGNLAEKAVISGVVGGSSCWFGYDIQNYEAVPNYYGTQNQGPGAGVNTFWTPETAAAISLGTSLKEGVLYRGYDGKESLFYLADAYTPNWAVPYDWKLITDAGCGGNENQNNLAIAEYSGRRVLAYTQGFHFDYSNNANIYVMDITDINDVKPLVTINPAENLVGELPFTGANSADVLLHPTDEALELFVINSGKGVVAKYKIVFE